MLELHYIIHRLSSVQRTFNEPQHRSCLDFLCLMIRHDSAEAIRAWWVASDFWLFARGFARFSTTSTLARFVREQHRAFGTTRQTQVVLDISGCQRCSWHSANTAGASNCLAEGWWNSDGSHWRCLNLWDTSDCEGAAALRISCICLDYAGLLAVMLRTTLFGCLNLFFYTCDLICLAPMLKGTLADKNDCFQG